MGNVIAVLIILGLHFIGLGIYIAKHGQHTTIQYNAGWRFLQFVVTILLFWWAGLFEVF